MEPGRRLGERDPRLLGAYRVPSPLGDRSFRWRARAVDGTSFALSRRRGHAYLLCFPRV